MSDLKRLKSKFRSNKFKAALQTGCSMTSEEMYGKDPQIALERFCDDLLGGPRIPLIFEDEDDQKVYVWGDVRQAPHEDKAE